MKNVYKQSDHAIIKMKIVGSAKCGATGDEYVHPAMACRVFFLSLGVLVNSNHQGDKRYDEYGVGYH